MYNASACFSLPGLCLPTGAGVRLRSCSALCPPLQAVSMLRQLLPPSAILVGQNIAKDVQWLGLKEGEHFEQASRARGASLPGIRPAPSALPPAGMALTRSCAACLPARAGVPAQATPKLPDPCARPRR